MAATSRLRDFIKLILASGGVVVALINVLPELLSQSPADKPGEEVERKAPPPAPVRWVHGRVVNPEREPLAGVLVDILAPTDLPAECLRRAETGDDGRFRLCAHGEGPEVRYRLALRRMNGDCHSGPLHRRFAPNDTQDIILTCEADQSQGPPQRPKAEQRAGRFSASRPTARLEATLVEDEVLEARLLGGALLRLHCSRAPGPVQVASVWVDDELLLRARGSAAEAGIARGHAFRLQMLELTADCRARIVVTLDGSRAK